MIKAVVFDLDGTIYFGNRLADKAGEVVNKLRDQGVKVCFLTNNSRLRRFDIYKKLLDFSLELEIQDVYSSSYLVGRYLKESSFTSAYVLGEKGLIQEIEDFGVKIDECDPDCVVIGYDRTIDYQKITVSFKHIMNKKPFIACNLDKNYPVESVLLPGCGAMVGAITGCTGFTPDVIVGKPALYPLEVICADIGVSIDEVMVVGDNIESDIAMAKSAGCKSCLIVSEDIDAACLVITSLDQIIGIIKKELE